MNEAELRDFKELVNARALIARTYLDSATEWLISGGRHGNGEVLKNLQYARAAIVGIISDANKK